MRVKLQLSLETIAGFFKRTQGNTRIAQSMNLHHTASGKSTTTLKAAKRHYVGHSCRATTSSTEQQRAKKIGIALGGDLTGVPVVVVAKELFALSTFPFFFPLVSFA